MAKYIGDEMDAKKIAHTVRALRKQSGLSQIELAALAGVGKSAVFDLEKAKETIQLNTLLKIFAVLNIRITLETPLPIHEEHQS